MSSIMSIKETLSILQTLEPTAQQGPDTIEEQHVEEEKKIDAQKDEPDSDIAINEIEVEIKRTTKKLDSLLEQRETIRNSNPSKLDPHL